jgi:mono/diheme cytochrome c family protein
MKIFITIGVVLLTGALGGLGIIYSGVYNVAASEPRSAFARWVLNTTMRNSVQLRAQDLTLPEQLDTPEQILAGINDYEAMCAGCHTPPGESPSALAKGLNPEPPDLAKSAEHMSAQELFWVIKNGVKWTGMPAWGSTHSDEELWPLVALVKELPDMKPDDYQQLKAAAKKKKAGHHSHALEEKAEHHHGHQHQH